MILNKDFTIRWEPHSILKVNFFVVSFVDDETLEKKKMHFQTVFQKKIK